MNIKPVITNMNFSQALIHLRKGELVSREGWNGKGMFLFLVPGSTFKVNRPPLLGIYPEGTEIQYLPHIDMKTADGKIVPWLASQTDLLAIDWCVVEIGKDAPSDTPFTDDFLKSRDPTATGFANYCDAIEFAKSLEKRMHKEIRRLERWMGTK